MTAGNPHKETEKVLGHELSDASVVVIDSLKLRRSCIARVLEQWSRSEGLSVTSIAPVGLPSEYEQEANCRLVVLSIGGASLTNADMLKTIESIHSIFTDAPLVVMSDRNEPSEVIAAFRVGAMGFIPASLDPQIALRAFTFILGGGTYFPPAALFSAGGAPLNNEANPSDKGGDDNGGFVSNLGSKEAASKKLTARQQDVVKLLRNGLPNKVIARHLGMTEATVKVHVRQIMRKLGANNRTQVALCLASLSIRNPELADPVIKRRQAAAN